MSLQIIPVPYAEGQVGDFQWMISSGDYPNSVYVFPDVYEAYYSSERGPGNQAVRPYNLFGMYQNVPISVSMPITSDAFGPFPDANAVGVSDSIYRSLLHLSWAIYMSSATQVYFQSKDSPTGGNPPDFDTNGLTGVGDDVIAAITSGIYALGTYTPPP